jgi:peptide/nickel transport system substrate-binding protein
VKKLMAQPHLACMSADSMGIPAVLGFNLESPLVERLSVRRAVALAVGLFAVERLPHERGGGHFHAGVGSAAHSSPADFSPWKQDPEESRSLLASTGWKDRDGTGYWRRPKGFPPC